MKKWTRINYQPCLPLGDGYTRITESKAHIGLSEEAACEGAVLLKNHHEILPLKKGQKIAVFGTAQIDYVKGGGGSGDVTVSYVRNIYAGLKMNDDMVQVFDELSLFYEKYVREQYQKGEKNGALTEVKVPAALMEGAVAFTDTAVITINRFSEEAVDRKNDGTDDYFELSPGEKELVKDVCAHFAHVIVLLNVGAMIDTSWFAQNDQIEAALMLWQGGMEGGLAAAKLLIGRANPSGKLADTCAKELADYPSSANFHEHEDYAKYTEDVFVGYRYFETVPGMKERVVYPFGYGLSYTTFAISNISAGEVGKNIYVKADVTNTGKYAGKEVVQLYYAPPTGKISKPALELCAFAKTPVIKPGETCSVSLEFEIAQMASFDDVGMIEKSAWVMEQGDYTLYLGNSIRNTVCIDYGYHLESDVVIEKLHSYCAPTRLGKRMLADGSYVDVPDSEVKLHEFPCEYECPYVDATGHLQGLIDVSEGRVSLDEFMTQLTDEELLNLMTGTPSTGVAHLNGMGNVPRLCVPNPMTTDGPAGVRVLAEREIYTTAFPVATTLACTWNTELLEEVGKAQALEVKENNLSIFLAPALNIHRSPLCGRNFEYFSEDPLISGKMAAAIIRGVQSQRIVAVAKHFACNNKETNRMHSDSIVSERALREIYLKGFEICVKEAEPKMIMSSYNYINGVRTCYSAELLTGILRKEWGYQGMVSSDWEVPAEHYKQVKAGNDIRMPKESIEPLREAFEKGLVTRNEMAACAKRIMEMILWLD